MKKGISPVNWLLSRNLATSPKILWWGRGGSHLPKLTATLICKRACPLILKTEWLQFGRFPLCPILSIPKSSEIGLDMSCHLSLSDFIILSMQYQRVFTSLHFHLSSHFLCSEENSLKKPPVVNCCRSLNRNYAG